MIADDINRLPKQFEYDPEVKNGDKLKGYNSYVIGGMGGSGATAGYVRVANPDLNVIAHHEYGVPRYLSRDDWSNRLFIAVSHSGNTEETLDFFEKAIEKGYDTAVVAAKGKLLELAKEKELPYVDIPGDQSQPRMCQGFMLRAALKLMGEAEAYEETSKLAETLNVESYQEKGRELAEAIYGKVPVIYSSRSNLISAFSWKRTLNETAKIPAFYNVFPELNHNEMQGFDVADATRPLSEGICFIFLGDDDDHERIKKRMEVTSKLYRDRGLRVEHVKVDGQSKLEKIFAGIGYAEWTALHISQKYGTEPEAVPMVEEFKKLI